MDPGYSDFIENLDSKLCTATITWLLVISIMEALCSFYEVANTEYYMLALTPGLSISKSLYCWSVYDVGMCQVLTVCNLGCGFRRWGPA